jgi:hypothetical protein
VVTSKNTGRPAAVQVLPPDEPPGVRMLRDAEWNARPIIGAPSRPAQYRQIAGRNFSVRFVLVNRPCFDHLPTPTAHFAVDGKRVSRTAAYTLAASLMTERRGL